MSREDDAYLKTIDRLEPEIAAIDVGGGWASIAISLRRIADALDRLVPETRPTHHHDYSYTVKRVGPVESPVPPKKEGVNP